MNAMMLDEYIGKTIKLGETLWVVSELVKNDNDYTDSTYHFVIQCGGCKVTAIPDMVEQALRHYLGGTCAECDGHCEWDYFLCQGCRHNG